MERLDFNNQSERRKTCAVNMHIFVVSGHTMLCRVPTDEQCERCKAHDYQPLGLGALMLGGFREIKQRQGCK